MSLSFYLKDPCPRCRKPLISAVIERHPIRSDIAVRKVECADCGPVKTETISLKPVKRSPGLAA
jgi:RNase P subunit RPR2